MPRHPKGPKLTGPDYLVVVANDAAENGQPYAAVFLTMIEQAIIGGGDPPLPTELVAGRALTEYEASPVAIILGAAAQARGRRDDQALEEVLTYGMALLAKWPVYLDMVLDGGHPHFNR